MRPISLACRIVLFATTVAVLGGCENPATKVSDADLTSLLGGEQGISVDTIDCLRAWSGEPTLSAGLTAEYAGQRKQDCRHQAETRLADSTRNPHKLSFENLAAPDVVRRAVAIQQQQQAIAQQRAQTEAAEKKRAADAAAAAARKHRDAARIAELGREFNATLADLRSECTRALDEVRDKRRVPDNLRKQIDACAEKADAQQQRWAGAVATNDVAAATRLLKAAHESVTGAKSLAVNAAKVRR